MRAARGRHAQRGFEPGCGGANNLDVATPASDYEWTIKRE